MTKFCFVNTGPHLCWVFESTLESLCTVPTLELRFKCIRVDISDTVKYLYSNIERKSGIVWKCLNNPNNVEKQDLVTYTVVYTAKWLTILETVFDIYSLTFAEKFIWAFCSKDRKTEYLSFCYRDVYKNHSVIWIHTCTPTTCLKKFQVFV